MEKVFNNEFFKKLFEFFDKTKFLSENEILLKRVDSGIIISYKNQINDYVHTEICNITDSNGYESNFIENQDYCKFLYFILDILEKYNNKHDSYRLIIGNEPNNDKEIGKVLKFISLDQLNQLHNNGYTVIKED